MQLISVGTLLDLLHARLSDRVKLFSGLQLGQISSLSPVFNSHNFIASLLKNAALSLWYPNFLSILRERALAFF